MRPVNILKNADENPFLKPLRLPSKAFGATSPMMPKNSPFFTRPQRYAKRFGRARPQRYAKHFGQARPQRYAKRFGRASKETSSSALNSSNVRLPFKADVNAPRIEDTFS
ncbi:MAG: hypothetical protein WCL23_01665 [Candidatus Moraniibacteriota bacterium]